MKFEKNSVIGVVLLALLFIGYFYFTRVGQLELEAKQKRVADSLAALQPAVKDTQLAVSTADTAALVKGTPGSFSPVGQINETFTTLENKLVKVVFSNKGGRPVSVELKQYTGNDSNQVKLMAAPFNRISYLINTGNNQTAATDELYFTAGEPVLSKDGGSTLVYRLADSSGRSLEHIYSLKDNDYMFDSSFQQPVQISCLPIIPLIWSGRSRPTSRREIFSLKNVKLSWG